MKIYREMDIYDFEPWSGAVCTYDRIYNEGKLDELENILEDLYPEGMDETDLNDLLWFEEEYLFDLLGIVDEDEEEDEDEDEEDLEGYYNSLAEAVEKLRKEIAENDA